MVWIKENWELIAIIAGSVGTLWNFLSEKWKGFITAPLRRQKAKADATSALLGNKGATMELVNSFENIIKELQDQIVELREALLQENKDKNIALLDKEDFILKVRRVFRKFLNKCEVLCGQSERCKELVEHGLSELNIKKDDYGPGPIK